MRDDRRMSAPEGLGAVAFDTSCKPQVAGDFNRGVALLHSFWYAEAKRAFEKVAAADPDCAMAYWAAALTDMHQIQGEPIPADVAAGQALLAKADSAGEKSGREALYVNALHLFYDAYRPGDFLAHATAYSDAMGAVVAANPDDIEANVFYALSLLAADPPTDVSLVNPKKAVAILMPLFKAYPNHPGIAHYIIHACDNPAMANQGLNAARHYAAVAPAAPHALHMPAHIFARLGLWREDIRSNLASKAAAEVPVGVHVGAENRLHALEFLEYAYLQIGNDDKARAIIDEAKAIDPADVDPSFPSFFSTVQARLSALYVIETQNWTMALNLTPVAGAGTFSQGLTLLAHAAAAGHLHDERAAQEASDAVDALLAARPAPPSTGSSLATLRDEIHAWTLFSQGHLEAAATLLRPVSEAQTKIGKQEVELPAREMLAEMLLLSGKTDEALKEYQASLASDPNRFNALLNAGRAAARLGRKTLATHYYRALLATCDGASGPASIQLAQAKKWLTRRSRN